MHIDPALVAIALALLAGVRKLGRIEQTLDAFAPLPARLEAAETAVAVHAARLDAAEDRLRVLGGLKGTP